MFSRPADEAQKSISDWAFSSLPDRIYIFFIYKEQADHVFSLRRQRNKYSKSFYAQFQFLIEKKKKDINEKY